ncbi:MAG: hypothetical protein V4598_10880 [Bdellovibrionota bacterium]
MKKIVLIPVIIVAGIFLYSFLTAPILFQSAESLTTEGGPVFNEITWGWKEGKEIWKMRQSHEGKNLPREKWDSLAIVMDQKATFLQLKPGTQERIEYKVSCFMCHSNGPRAIRPVEGSLNISDSLKVKMLNLRIKFYGRVKSEGVSIGKTPFRHDGKISNAPLELSRCTSCHKEDGLHARGTLTRQNSITINFMVKNEHMPPFGELTPKEQQYLENFMEGI